METHDMPDQQKWLTLRDIEREYGPPRLPQPPKRGAIMGMVNAGLLHPQTFPTTGETLYFDRDELEQVLVGKPYQPKSTDQAAG
jgi:hypothetical protein